jgi:hypothetical protein
MTEQHSVGVEELSKIVRGQQTSLDAIHDSLKMIEVVLCTKTTNDVEKQTEVTNHVINLDDDTTEEQVPNGSKGKRKSLGNDYDSDLDKDNEAANTDLIWSDGDYEYHSDEMNKRICKTVNNLNLQIKPNVPILVLLDAWTALENLRKTSDLSNPMRSSNNNFKRVPNDNMMQDDIQLLHGISKKLFETPPTSSQGKRGSSSGRGKKALHGSTSTGSKKFRSVLPKVK